MILSTADIQSAGYFKTALAVLSERSIIRPEHGMVSACQEHVFTIVNGGPHALQQHSLHPDTVSNHLIRFQSIHRLELMLQRLSALLKIKDMTKRANPVATEENAFQVKLAQTVYRHKRMSSNLKKNC